METPDRGKPLTKKQKKAYRNFLFSEVKDIVMPLRCQYIGHWVAWVQSEVTEEVLGQQREEGLCTPH